MILQIIAGILLLFIIGVIIFMKYAPQFGKPTVGSRMERIFKSPNYSEGRFQNLVPTPMSGENHPMWKNGLKFLKKDKSREPDKVLETIKFDKAAFTSSPNNLTVCWFGHSTLLINLNGTIILTDPVFSETASPVSFMGVKRFAYSNQYLADDMPAIDVVLISHDHYDHLDYHSIKSLSPKVKKFIVPLGVAAHLMHWGIDEDKIIEMDWWENSQYDNNTNFTSTPTRHFSGRKGVDKDNTLWCSYVIESKGTKVYYCGDSGYGEHFKQIGEKFGPFDLTLMECGQYNEGWPYIHMMPEQSVQANVDLRGKIMLPIHWGKFKLSLHKWTEPLERSKKEAERLSVHLISPTPGEIVVIQENVEDKTIKAYETEEISELAKR